jgi:hypothetical protein
LEYCYKINFLEVSKWIPHGRIKCLDMAKHKQQNKKEAKKGTAKQAEQLGICGQ